MIEADNYLKRLSASTWDIAKWLSTLIWVMLPLQLLRRCLCCRCTGFFIIVELAPCLAPLPSLHWRCRPSCQGAWPLNGREGPPLLYTSRQVAFAFALLPMQTASQLKRRTSFQRHINPQQQAHQQDPRGFVGSKSPSQVLTELGNAGLSWHEGGWKRIESSMHSMPQWLQASALEVSKFFVQSMLLVRCMIIDRNKH